MSDPSPAPEPQDAPLEEFDAERSEEPGVGPVDGPGPNDDDSEGAASEPVSVEELLDTVETVTAERDAHLADLQRVSAEFANFRKQTDKRQGELVEQAAARLANALLPVLDACDAAAQQGVDVGPVQQQLLAVLEKEGLESLAAPGDPFDPHRHEAAMTEPGDDTTDGPVVARVLRAGYGWNGRVLRAAMVAVSG